MRAATLCITAVALAVVPASAGPRFTAGKTIELTGIVRDFRERTAEGGHPDFERRPEHGFKHSMGNVDPILGVDGKPVFTGNGFVVERQWKDAQDRSISHAIAVRSPRPGDVLGLEGPPDSGGIQSSKSFGLWFQDAPGINMPMVLSITLHRQEDGSYLFDDRLDPDYKDLGGFFPIENRLMGNPGGEPDRNFHFTFEIHFEFVYEEETGQFLEFLGDDDVWVFIDDELVIDLGGVHWAKFQYVDLDRLDLVDGEDYRVDFFFAERHREHSRFRLATNLRNVRSVDPEPTTAAAE